MKYIYPLLFLLTIMVALGACTPSKNVAPTLAIASQVRPTLQQPTLTTTPIASETTRPILIPTNTPTSPPTFTPSPSPSPTFGPLLVANLAMNPFRETLIPDHVWWSDDSQTLFYQDVTAQMAWAYDIEQGTTTQIPYVSRLFQDQVLEFQGEVPENARIISISPEQKYVLYKILLPELIPFRPLTYQGEASPVYAFELWLLKNGQHINLGMVDNCFSVLERPKWSKEENMAIVNTYGTPDVTYPCMYDSWLIDLEELSVGPFPSPWEENRESYKILDMSNEGTVILVREDENVIFNRETGEQIRVPDSDTLNTVFIGSVENPGALIFQLLPPYDIILDAVWYFDSSMDERQLLFTIDGVISQGIISPNRRMFAFTVNNQFSGVISEKIEPSLWLIALPNPES